jgi:predicted Zn-dependent protease
MQLGIPALIKILRSVSSIDEWLIVERSTRRMRHTLGPPGSGEVVGHRLSVLVFRDIENGRGSARVDFAGEDEAAARARLAAAADQAVLAVGPGWVLPPPAAPARVEVADPDVVGNLAGVVAEMSRKLARSPDLGVVRSELAAELTVHRIASSHEFASEYQETRLSFDVTLAKGAGPVRGAARRLRDLHLEERLIRARTNAQVRLSARHLEPGAYDLLLGRESIAMPRYGWFAPLVAQASGQRIRLGLSRYRPGHKVFAHGGEGFTLVSDGTIPFGILSAPFGSLGEPVRRFVLVEDGVAVDAALDLREAAVAGVPPNGGVRNLVLSPGAEKAALLSAPGERPLLHVHQLAWLDADPQSGDLTAEIALAGLERAGASPMVVTGGLFSGNAFDLLGRARRSRESGEAGWYRGPQALRIDRVDVVR